MLHANYYDIAYTIDMLALLLLFLYNLLNISSMFMSTVIACTIATRYVDDIVKGFKFCYGKHKSCKE